MGFETKLEPIKEPTFDQAAQARNTLRNFCSKTPCEKCRFSPDGYDRCVFVLDKEDVTAPADWSGE